MSLKRVGRPILHLSLLMALMSIAGCRDDPIHVTQAIKSPKPQVPVVVRLSMQDIPSLGGTVHLTLEVKPLMDAPLIRMGFILPEGLEIVSGQSSWIGQMGQGEIKTLEIMARIGDEKRYIVQGMATLQQQEGRSYTGVDSLVIDLERKGRTQIGIDTLTPDPESQDREKGQSNPIIKKSRDHKDVMEFKGQ